MERVFVVMGAVGLVGCFVSVDVGGPDSGARADAGRIPCSSSAPCPSGQTCFNGVCAARCTSNDGCAAGQFCGGGDDKLCHETTPPTCKAGEASACASSQLCVEGHCSAKPTTTQCNEFQVLSGNDGCDSTSLCVAPVGGNQPEKACFALDACGPDGACATGEAGAVCNDGAIPSKGRLCLIGWCRTAANCPSGWSCVKMFSGDALGSCWDRTSGSACSQPSDCESGTCSKPLPGAAGFCS